MKWYMALLLAFIIFMAVALGREMGIAICPHNYTCIEKEQRK